MTQQDTDMHESNAGSYQLSHTWDHEISEIRAPSSCKQSTRCDQDVQTGNNTPFLQPPEDSAIHS